MYSVYYGNKASEMEILWAPGLSDEKYACYGLNADLAVSEAGSLSFTLPQCSGAYTNIKSLVTLFELRDTLAVNTDETSEDYNPDGVVWEGRVLSVDRDFYNQKSIVCEGTLAFLSDTVQLWDDTFIRGNPGDFVKAVLEGYKSAYDHEEHGHNDMSPYRQIHYEWASGKNYIDSGIGNNTVTIDGLDLNSYTTSLSLLQSAFSVYDGFFYIRYRGIGSDGHRQRYLGFKLTANAELSNQPISFGSNLVDLNESIDATEVINCIHPFGALMDDEAENPTIFDRWQLNTHLDSETMTAEQAAADVKAYSGGRLTDGKYYDDTYDSTAKLYEWFIRRSNADSSYDVPPVWEVVVFDDVGAWTDTGKTDDDGEAIKTRDDPNVIREKLVQAAVNYLETKIQKELVINVTAVDLRDAGYEYSRMMPGQKFPVSSAPHGYDQELILTKCSINIQNPDSNKYTLGYTGKTMSDDVFGTSKGLSALTQEVQLLESSNGSALAQAKEAQKSADEAKEAVNDLKFTTYSASGGTKLFSFSVDGGATTHEVHGSVLGVSSRATCSINADKVFYRTITIDGTDYNILLADAN